MKVFLGVWRRGGITALSVAALFAAYAAAAPVAARADPLQPGPALDLSPTKTAPAARAAIVTCAAVDPASVPGWHPSPALDRSACTNEATPAGRDLIKVQHADVSLALHFAGDQQQGLGLLRGLASFQRALNLGPLSGWQFRADAEFGGAANWNFMTPIEERIKLSLSPQILSPWGVRFEANGSARGIVDPSSAAERRLELAANASRSLFGTHKVSLRLAQDIAQDGVAHTEQQRDSAALGYSHATSFGALGANLMLSRTTSDNIAPAQSEAVVKINFTRPF